jgi:signal transduction histidine kinase
MQEISPPQPVLVDRRFEEDTGWGGTSAGVSLGLHQLCRDLQQEVGVLELLLRSLVAQREPGALEVAALAQLGVVRTTLREALLPALLRPVALQSLVSEVVATMRLLHHGTIELDALARSADGGERGGPVVAGLPGDLRRAVVGLVEHARAVTPLGALRVTLCSTDASALLEVEDDGPAPGGDSSSRVGLAVVSDVARTHGGEIVRRVTPGGRRVIGLRLPHAGA